MAAVVVVRADLIRGFIGIHSVPVFALLYTRALALTISMKVRCEPNLLAIILNGRSVIPDMGASITGKGNVVCPIFRGCIGITHMEGHT